LRSRKRTKFLKPSRSSYEKEQKDRPTKKTGSFKGSSGSSGFLEPVLALHGAGAIQGSGKQKKIKLKEDNMKKINKTPFDMESKKVIVHVEGGMVQAVETDLRHGLEIWVIDDDPRGDADGGDWTYYEAPETEPGELFERLEEFKKKEVGNE
jgi:hypothetical protein